MITKLQLTTVCVKDQQAALEFYTEKLGFEVRTARCTAARWLERWRGAGRPTTSSMMDGRCRLRPTRGERSMISSSATRPRSCQTSTGAVKEHVPLI